jgi:hypothetical protein
VQPQLAHHGCEFPGGCRIDPAFDDAAAFEHRQTLRLGHLEPGFEPREQFLVTARCETRSGERHLQEAHVWPSHWALFSLSEENGW